MEQFFNRAFRKVEAVQVERAGCRNVADRRFDCFRLTINPTDNPLQHPEILAITGPEESAVLAPSKPVHLEYSREVLTLSREAQPVLEIVTHVVATERNHCHRVLPQPTDHSVSRGGGLDPHHGTYQDARFPAECLVDQGDSLRPSPAEEEGRSRNSLWVIRLGRKHRVLTDGDGKPRIWMGGWSPTRFPHSALPVPYRRDGRLRVPPRRSLGSQRDVREYRILSDRLQKVWIGLRTRVRSNAEK